MVTVWPSNCVRRAWATGICYGLVLSRTSNSSEFTGGMEDDERDDWIGEEQFSGNFDQLQPKKWVCLHSVTFSAPNLKRAHFMMETSWSGKYRLSRVRQGICCDTALQRSSNLLQWFIQSEGCESDGHVFSSKCQIDFQSPMVGAESHGINRMKDPMGRIAQVSAKVQQSTRLASVNICRQRLELKCIFC